MSILRDDAILNTKVYIWIIGLTTLNYMVSKFIVDFGLTDHDIQKVFLLEVLLFALIGSKKKNIFVYMGLIGLSMTSIPIFLNYISDNNADEVLYMNLVCITIFGIALSGIGVLNLLIKEEYLLNFVYAITLTYIFFLGF